MLARLLRSAPNVASARPTPDRWSILEYGAHVRDVLLVFRDRFVVGVVAEGPELTPMYRDERVDRGMYPRRGSGGTGHRARTGGGGCSHGCSRH